MFESSNQPDLPTRPEDEVTLRTGQSGGKSDAAAEDSAPHRAGELQQSPGKFGGEAAPDITPEQFQRLMEEGSINVDGRGRVRTSRRASSQEGMSLRKRRAWYVE